MVFHVEVPAGTCLKLEKRSSVLGFRYKQVLLYLGLCLRWRSEECRVLHSEEVRNLCAQFVLTFLLNRGCDGLGMWVGYLVKVCEQNLSGVTH